MQQQKRKMMNQLLFIILLNCSFVLQLTAQEQIDEMQYPCLQSEHEKLQFLQGEWTVVSRKRTTFASDSWSKSTGKSEWTPVLGGCSFRETWSGRLDNKLLEWLQYITYNKRKDCWELTLIDSAHGNAITSEGYYQNNSFIFTSSQMREGKLLIDKIIIEQVDENNLRWRTETSLDGGESWIRFWEMDYTKVHP